MIPSQMTCLHKQMRGDAEYATTTITSGIGISGWNLQGMSIVDVSIFLRQNHWTMLLFLEVKLSLTKKNEYFAF